MFPMADEEWEEVVQELPSRDQPSLQAFENGREALIAQEKKFRSGREPPH
jgi:adenosine deaminase CECR1